MRARIRSGLLGTAVVLVVIVVCVRLGLWQLDRLEQRRDRNHAVAERMAASPVAIARVPWDTTGLIGRRVELVGEFDHARSIVLRGRTYRGMPGVHVITPLRVSGGKAVAVNRGWVPAADGRSVDLAEIAAAAPARVGGFAMSYPLETGGADATTGASPVGTTDSLPRAWLRLDGGELRRSLPYPLADFYVQAAPGDGAASVPVPLSPPELSDGPHLGYAVQWFGFAAVAFFGWVILVARRGSAPRSAAGTDPIRARPSSAPDR